MEHTNSQMRELSVNSDDEDLGISGTRNIVVDDLSDSALPIFQDEASRPSNRVQERISRQNTGQSAYGYDGTRTQSQQVDEPVIIITKSKYKSVPKIVFYPPLLSSGLQDEEVKRYNYKDFPSTDYSNKEMRRLNHWSFRFWIDPMDEDDVELHGKDVLDLIGNANARADHTEVLRGKLVGSGVMLPGFATYVKFYYGKTLLKSDKPKGEEQDSGDPPESSRLYLDIQLPSWEPEIAQKLVTPKLLRSNKTLLTWLGENGGLGPIAPPYYALAETTAPNLVDGVLTDTTVEEFMEFCRGAHESFKTWRNRHNTKQEIVAWGGFFVDDETGALDKWDLRLFMIYRVPVPSNLAGTNDAQALRSELSKFPPYTKWGSMVLRNNLNFRMMCIVCKYDAKDIHDITGHRCTICNRVGHAPAKCESRVERKRKSNPEEDEWTIATTCQSAEHAEHKARLLQNPAMLAFEKAFEERQRKRRRF